MAATLYRSLRSAVEQLAAPGVSVTKTALRSVLAAHPPLTGTFDPRDFDPRDFG